MSYIWDLLALRPVKKLCKLHYLEVLKLGEMSSARVLHPGIRDFVSCGLLCAFVNVCLCVTHINVCCSEELQ